MNIKISTDSACDLPKEYLDKYDIDVIPIYITHDEEQYQDGITITKKELYDGMRKGKVYKTAQITVNDFKQRFKKYAENNQSYIHLSFSSGLSGTYQASVLALQDIKETYPNADIHVIDTKAASSGLALIVLKVAQLASEGKSLEEILNKTNYYVDHIEHIFTVVDLEYLYRGGRLSKGAAVMGNLLNINPILHMKKTGHLEQIEKIRGNKKLFNRMVAIVEERGICLDRQIFTISHCDSIDSALKLKEMIENKFGAKDFIINIMSSTLGAHTGPGTFCISFFNDLEQ